ncbi:Tetratricopeptide repeat protein [Sulfidibacter corallicola]
MVVCWCLLLWMGPGPSLWMGPGPSLDQCIAWVDRGRKALNRGREKEASHAFRMAKKALQRFIEKNPEHERALFLLGKTYFYTGEDQPAADMLSQLVALYPDNHQAWFYKGLAEMYGGKHGAASQAFDKASRLEPANPSYFEEWGRSLAFQGRHHEALKAYEQVLILSPSSETALFQTGVALNAIGDHREALVRFLEVLMINPEHQNAYYNAGQIHQLLGEHRKALSQYLKLARLAPQDGATLAKIVQLYDALNNTRKRDAYRGRLFALWQQSHDDPQIKRGFYCCAQFVEGDYKVVSLEYFEPKGNPARKWLFQVYDASMVEILFEISWCADDDLDGPAQVARQLGDANQRTYQLEGLWPNGDHRTFGEFPGERDFDQVRALVVQILRGNLEPIAVSENPLGDKTP